MEPTADEPRLRSFVAIDLADPARSAIVAYLERLRATVGGVAWTRTENLHLTLKFLGDIAAGRIPSLADRLCAVAAATRPFTLQVVGVGAFPNLAHPRALWIGVAAPALRPLADAVEAACVAEGFAAERRALRPHVTLGRIRSHRRRGAPDLTLLTPDGGREFGVAPVESVVLFRSELRSEGARHTVLATYPLAGG
ncbi:MAG: 2'-5' ligase [Deltaproteobacteria bacterium]|nr:2'-5' ligase [Deltaproteobacteria bacterium]